MYMKIRSATPGDAKALAGLISLAYRVEDFFVIGDRTNEAQVLALMEKSTLLLLEGESSELIGSVYVDVRGDTGYFGMLSIDPARQGRGFGARLIDAAERLCIDAGCSTMEIEVVNLRTELPDFYRRRGYAETGTRPFSPNERTKLPCHFIVMMKPLSRTM